MRAPVSPELLQLLHSLLGMHGQYAGESYQLIEIIDSSAMLVLEALAADPVVQNSFTGEARRIVQKSYTINILSEVRADLHPVAASFFGEHISAVLREQLAHDIAAAP